VHIAPQRLAQLGLRDNLACTGNEKTKRRQFPGGQMNDRLSPQKDAIGLEPEARKREFPIRAAWIGR